ncbi:MAG: hypothetical protein JXB14_02400 [Candidatus Altiarchaeota archaeon]|nr:hypothetical protein [Candidatus Altiarchaeota archaeon]
MNAEDCKVTIRLEDRPGELSKILEIIAKNNGNLFSVSHLRERKKEGYLPVLIQFQAAKQGFDGIIRDLEKNNIEVYDKSIGGLKEEKLSTDFILIGHVIDTDLKDTIYKLSADGAMIKALDVGIKSLKDPSSVFVQIAAKDPSSMAKTMASLRDLCKQKKLMLIEELQT